MKPKKPTYKAVFTTMVPLVATDERSAMAEAVKIAKATKDMTVLEYRLERVAASGSRTP